MSPSPDYGSYSLDELTDALNHINEFEHPERTKIIREEITKKKNVKKIFEDDIPNNDTVTDFNIDEINWRLVLKYFFIIFITSFSLSFPFGFLQGFLNSIGRSLPAWSGSIQILVQYIGVTIVFAYLSIKYQKEAFLHAITIAIISWLISIPFKVFFEGVPLIQSIAGIMFWLITSGIGTGIGIMIYNSRGKKRNK